MRRMCRSRLIWLAVLILGGSLFVAAPAGAKEEKAYSLRASYSLLEEFGFELSRRFNPSFYLNLGFSDQRWRLQAEFLPVPAWTFKAGYDVTDEKYLAGLEHRWRLGENITLLSALDYFRLREGEGSSLDYRSCFQIGIGGDNLVYAGVQGEYVPPAVNNPAVHNPEFFIQLDLNWYFRRGWHLRFEPTIMVEGDFYHRLTLDRKWENGITGGLYIGQNRDYYWDAGLFIHL